MIKEDLVKEFEEAIEKRNYVRSVKIAHSLGKPEVEIRKLKIMAIKQFLVEFRNPQGTIHLAKEFHLSKEEFENFIREIIQESKEKGILERRQFDIHQMDYLSLGEWIKKYLTNFKIL